MYRLLKAGVHEVFPVCCIFRLKVPINQEVLYVFPSGRAAFCAPSCRAEANLQGSLRSPLWSCGAHPCTERCSDRIGHPSSFGFREDSSRRKSRKYGEVVVQTHGSQK
mmetsp:Transcript_23179/g.50880  ORF Transcript_23179/g.50880 Transcript_23179/m.50880 type:complete len:108 (+) Transcript_23179:95-418(+)